MHQVTNNKGFYIKEETKAEPDPIPNSNATFHMLLKHNAQGTTRRVLLKYHVRGMYTTSVSIAIVWFRATDQCQ